MLLIPLLDLRADDASSPSLDCTGYIIAFPADIDTESVLEQFRCGLPFVAFELPGLTRCEDGHDAVPVVGFELLGGVDEDESERALRIDARQDTGDVE